LSSVLPGTGPLQQGPVALARLRAQDGDVGGLVRASQHSLAEPRPWRVRGGAEAICLIECTCTRIPNIPDSGALGTRGRALGHGTPLTVQCVGEVSALGLLPWPQILAFGRLGSFWRLRTTAVCSFLGRWMGLHFVTMQRGGHVAESHPPTRSAWEGLLRLW